MSDYVPNVRCEVTKCGVFVARQYGECVGVSVPARTGNDWSKKTEFMDLPLMNEETYRTFVATLAKFTVMFEGDGK